MPFGLTNAHATFQCLMNALFGDYMRKFVLIFMYGMLVFSKTLDQHVKHLRMVFQTLLENKLFIKFSKCTFAQQKISYLGHIISNHGVSTDPEKTDAMLNWPIPQNFTELRGFLGLTGYYRKFVKHYVTVLGTSHRAQDARGGAAPGNEWVVEVRWVRLLRHQ
jgi:hypothetical protein